MLLSFCTLSHKSRKRQLCIFLIISSICILRNGNFQIFVNFFTPASQKNCARRGVPHRSSSFTAAYEIYPHIIPRTTASRTAFMTQTARKKQISLCVAVLHVTAQSPLAKIHVRTDGNGGHFYEKQRRRQNTAGDRSRL